VAPCLPYQRRRGEINPDGLFGDWLSPRHTTSSHHHEGYLRIYADVVDITDNQMKQDFLMGLTPISGYFGYVIATRGQTLDHQQPHSCGRAGRWKIQLRMVGAC